MFLKRYIAAALILMVLVGWYVYAFVSHESMGLDVFGIHFPPLPIAFWVVLPLILLAVASVLHMAYYSMIGSFKLRRYQKDFEKLTAMLSDLFLGKQTGAVEFKTERYALLGKVMQQSRIFPAGELKTVGHEKLDKTFELINRLKEGDVVELGKYHLEADNPIAVQNQRNRYHKGDVNAESVLAKPEKYAEALRKEAFVDLVKTAPQHVIELYKHYFDLQTLETVLGRINAVENRLEVANEVLVEWMLPLEPSETDYIRASRILGVQMIPDQRIKLFEMLGERDETATAAYLYTLFDLEMVDAANEILQGSQDDEFLKLKAYSALKECGKNYNIELFI